MAKSPTLQALLDRAGLTYGEVAKRAGISDRALLALRDGVVARARATTVAGLAKALGVDAAVVRRAIEASAAAKS